MRKFTNSENEWIQRFVNKKELGLNAIQDLQVAKLLKTYFSFFALKWTYDENPQITFYYRKTDSDKDNILFQEQYYKICDFIYFLKELETLGFIAIQKPPSEKDKPQYSILLDKGKYFYNEKLDRIEPINQLPQNITKLLNNQNFLFEEIDPSVYILLQLNTQKINIDFAYDLQKYGLGIIYPLSLAKDYVDNKFKTLEDRHHDEEMANALKSVRWSKYAVIIGFFTLIITFFTLIISVISLVSTKN